MRCTDSPTILDTTGTTFRDTAPLEPKFGSSDSTESLGDPEAPTPGGKGESREKKREQHDLKIVVGSAESAGNNNEECGQMEVPQVAPVSDLRIAVPASASATSAASQHPDEPSLQNNSYYFLCVCSVFSRFQSSFFATSRIASMLYSLITMAYLGHQAGDEVAPGASLITLFLNSCFNTSLVSLNYISNKTSQNLKKEGEGSTNALVAKILPDALAYAMLSGVPAMFPLLLSNYIIGGLFEESAPIAAFAGRYLFRFAFSLPFQLANYAMQRILLALNEQATILKATAAQIFLSVIILSFSKQLDASRESSVGISYSISSMVVSVYLGVQMHYKYKINWLSTLKNSLASLRSLRCSLKRSSNSAQAPLLPEDSYLKKFIKHGTRQALQSGSEFLGLFLLTTIIGQYFFAKSLLAGFQYPLLVYSFMSMLQFVCGQVAGLRNSAILGSLRESTEIGERVRLLKKIFDNSTQMVLAGFGVALLLAMSCDLLIGPWIIPILPSLSPQDQSNTTTVLWWLTIMQVFDAIATQLNVALGALDQTAWPSRLSFVFRFVIPVFLDIVIFSATSDPQIAMQYMLAAHLFPLLFLSKILYSTLIKTIEEKKLQPGGSDSPVTPGSDEVQGATNEQESSRWRPCSFWSKAVSGSKELSRRLLDCQYKPMLEARTESSISLISANS